MLEALTVEEAVIDTARAARIAALKAQLGKQIGDLADPSKGFALLDFPAYPNVGDSLIWLGAVAHFQETHRRTPGYVCTKSDFDAQALRDACPSGPIYLSGGGNFGDVWPKFQRFRLQVLRAFPGRPVIQLPQTIHFQSLPTEPNLLDETRRAIAGHGAFSLLVRDEASLAFAASNFDCETYLTPDLAFCLGDLSAQRQEPVVETLLLLRDDVERADGRDGPVSVTGTSEQADWIDADHSLIGKLQWRIGALTSFGAGYPSHWHRAATARMRFGAELLSRGSRVITDRLHGHIFSLLLGIPHAVIDNSYGKVHGFARRWTHDLPGVKLATSVSEGDRLLRTERAA